MKGLYVLKPFADPPKPAPPVHIYYFPCRYPVRLSMINRLIPTTRLVGVHCKPDWAKDPSSGTKA